MDMKDAWNLRPAHLAPTNYFDAEKSGRPGSVFFLRGFRRSFRRIDLLRVTLRPAFEVDLDPNPA